jgi:Ca2+-binding RTX toxin-like protein
VLTGTEAAIGRGNLLDNLMQGNEAANRLFGFAGADTLLGGEGNDTLDGGAGPDLLEGGGGNDSYTVDDAGDAIVEAEDGGTEVVVATITWTLADHLEILLLQGTAALDGSGNALANRLVGNRGANRLSGGEGADTLDGGIGADTLEGGAGDDIYLVNSAADLVIEAADAGKEVVRSTVTYTLAAEVESLLLMGNASLNGTGNALGNAITGTLLANRLAGLDGHDVLSGLDGADTLEGGEGKDKLLGGEGDDLLTGGAGNDTLTGGGGADRFRFGAPGEGIDRITDFTPGADLILVSAAGFGGLLPPGALDAANLAMDAPNAAVAQFVYVVASGLLTFDADGSGAGEAVRLSVLDNKPALTAADILVIA